MIGTSLSALIAALVVFTALWGWGQLSRDAILRWTRDRVEGFAASIGLGSVLALSGIANLLQLPNSFVTIVLCAVGIAAALSYLLCFSNGIGRQDLLQRISLPLLLCLLAVPLFIDGLTVAGINGHDDAYSYLVAPVGIHQAGSYIPDPFNYRMAVANPGGLSYLQAGLLTVLDLQQISLLDRSVGILILVEALTVLLRRYRVSHWSAVPVLAPVFILVIPSTVNLSATYLLVALTLAVVGLFTHGGSGRPGHLVAAALVVSGMISMKLLGAVFAAPIIAVFFLISVASRRQSTTAAARNFLLTTGVAVAALAPWLLPFVTVDKVLVTLSWGPGADQMSLQRLLSLAGRNAVYKYYLPLLVVGIVAAWKCRASRDDIIAVLTGSIIAALLVTLLSGAVALGRYEILVLLPAFLFCSFVLLGTIMKASWQITVAACIAMGLVQYQPATVNKAETIRKVLHWPGRFLFTHRFLQRHEIPLQDEAGMVSATSAQAGMIPGARALVWTDRPYLFDFERNHLHVPDFPCASSPAPGVPCSQDWPTVARYLRQENIRYLVYAHRSQAGFSTEMVQNRLENKSFTPWQRVLNRLAPVFHTHVAEMSAHCRNNYRDNNLIVLDLETCNP